MRKYVLFVVAAWLLNACSHAEIDADAAAKEQAQKFAEAYFNYDFVKARQFVTSDSEKWLRFAASNVVQEDIDLLNAIQKSASVEVTDCDYQNDSVAHVTLAVYNVVLKDSIGEPAYMAGEAEFALSLVKRNGDYQVRMEGLPRNGKQSRGSTSGE